MIKVKTEMFILKTQNYVENDKILNMNFKKYVCTNETKQKKKKKHKIVIYVIAQERKRNV